MKAMITTGTCLVLLCAATVAQDRETTRPNILFILADDLGYGELGYQGCPDVRTPRLDALAAGGMRFTDAYANGPVCSPTRYAFMTGRYQQRGGLEYALYYQQAGAGLPPNGPTVAGRLRDAGWHTALIGKWHVGYDGDRRPNPQGFDHFFGLLGGNHHYFEHMDRIGHPDLYLNDKPVKREGYSTDLFTDDALRFVRETRDRPFFLFLSHLAPHFPYQGPGDAGRIVKPKSPSWQSGARSNVVSMIEHLDLSIGRVLDEIDRLGLAESTLVVFTSDNGGDPMGRNLPLSGLKGSLQEGGIRVPCIARWPGVIPAGTVSGVPIITMDWTATILHLAHATADLPLDGMNLMPVLRGESGFAPRTLFWRRVPEPVRKNVLPQRALRSGKWKYLEDHDQPARLFDLSSDPSETNDRAALHPDLLLGFKAELDAWESAMPESNPSVAKSATRTITDDVATDPPAR